MNRLTRRGMRLAVMTVVFAGLFIAVNAVPGAATPVDPKGSFYSTLVGHATLPRGILIVKPNLEVVVSRNEVKAGGTSGWHSHPGGAVVFVTQGEITTYRSVASDQGEDSGDGGNFICVRTKHGVGDVFFERAGEPLIAKNTGTVLTIVIATFPSVPVVNGATQQRTDETNPGTCFKEFGV